MQSPPKERLRSDMKDRPATKEPAFDYNIGTELSKQLKPDSPAFWKDMYEQKTLVNWYLKDTETNLQSFGDHFQSTNNSHFQTYNQMIANHTQGGFEDITQTLEQLNDLRNKLNAACRSWHDAGKKAALSVTTFNDRIHSYEVKQKDYQTKMKKHLSKKEDRDAKKGGIVSDKQKALEAEDDKLKLSKHDLACHRVELFGDILTLKASREKQVLAPVDGLMTSYWEFFKAGYELLAPLQERMQALNAKVVDSTAKSTKFDGDLEKFKKEWEKQALNSLTPSDPNLLHIRNIRDLDAKHATSTSTAQKEGYLYLPEPKFARVWVTLKDGQLLIEHTDTPGQDIMLPIMLCTAKEAQKDNRLRFVFTVISPQKTVFLQADSYEVMRDWLSVIQNAVSYQLFARQSIQQREAEAAAANASGAGAGAGGAGAGAAGGGDDLKSKMEQAQTQMKKELREVKGNDACADCSSPNPEWMSINLGIMICMNCSGVHRSLGVQISKVRSLALDKIDKYLLAHLKTIGNTNANEIWEATLRKGGAATAHRPNKASNNWIITKYKQRSFVGKKVTDAGELNKMLLQGIADNKPLDIYQALALGADPNKRDEEEESRTALHVAVRHGNPVVVELLIQNGADTSLQEARGWTALHYAAYQDDIELVQLLLLRGGSALVTIQDGEGHTPLDIANVYCVEENGPPKVSPLFAEAMARNNTREGGASGAGSMSERNNNNASSSSSSSSSSLMPTVSEDARPVSPAGARP